MSGSAGIHLTKRELRQRLVLAFQSDARALCERVGVDYDWSIEEVAEHLARCTEDMIRCVACELGEFEEQIVAQALNNLEAHSKPPLCKDEEP